MSSDLNHLGSLLFHPLEFLAGREPPSSVVTSQGADVVDPQILGAVRKHSSPGCNSCY